MMDLRKRIGRVGDSIRGELPAVFVGPDGQASVEGLILGIVRSARAADDEDEQTEKELRKAASKRRRRLGLASLATGPFAGITGEITDLYSETATVVDIVELHDLTLTDAQIGGHMVVLWGLSDDAEAAAKALEGSGPPLVELLVTDIATEYLAARTVPAKIKVIWKHRGVMNDARAAVTTGAFKRVLLAGRETRDLIERAERQLGVGGLRS